MIIAIKFNFIYIEYLFTNIIIYNDELILLRNNQILSNYVLYFSKI
jgi:hypothetical protein